VKVEFLKEYSARTASGETRTVAAGTVLDLQPEKAARLAAAGIVLDAGSIPALWKWFVAAADEVYCTDKISPEVWELHKKHWRAALALSNDCRIQEARRELENALKVLQHNL
jgi:hypothetical protein